MDFTRCDVCGVVVAESLADCWNCRRNMAQARSEALTRVWQGKDVPKANQALSVREPSRTEIAMNMMMRMWQGDEVTQAAHAVRLADALIAELKKEVAE